MTVDWLKPYSFITLVLSQNQFQRTYLMTQFFLLSDIIYLQHWKKPTHLQYILEKIRISCCPSLAEKQKYRVTDFGMNCEKCKIITYFSSMPFEFEINRNQCKQHGNNESCLG